MTHAEQKLSQRSQDRFRMTTHLRDFRILPATEPMRTELQPVSKPTDARMEAWLKTEFARRHDDGYRAGASNATAALFAGMLMGAGSTALMIRLTTLIL
jgi:hypothetical protein